MINSREFLEQFPKKNMLLEIRMRNKRIQTLIANGYSEDNIERIPGTIEPRLLQNAKKVLTADAFFARFGNQ
jgi:hypothetical protein